MSFQPWCAALKCPAPEDCAGYIDRNHGNQTTETFVACCTILCGQSGNKNMLALQCGGASPATAVGTIAYLLALLSAGGYIIAVGPFRRAKSFTFFVIAGGSLIFNTGTGVFVTNVTSPFRVLESLPAVGAMNVAVFFYFFSGFQYAVGLAYEGAPLVVLLTTFYTIAKEIPLQVEGPIRDANWIAMAMLVTAGIWIFHSVSYRLYGYRVDWRLALQEDRQQGTRPGPLNPNFHLGAAQGNPTWRTPVGQSSSVLLTAFAWSVFSFVKQDLANLGCRPGWVFLAMLYGAPTLISLSILWHVLSALRCRTIHNVTVPAKLETRTPQRPGWFSWLLPKKSTAVDIEDRPHFTVASVTVHADYPGSKPYVDFWAHRKEFRKWNAKVRREYVQAAALQRMGRNSLHAEVVPGNRLHWTDHCLGCVAWFLAQLGLLLFSFGLFFLWLLSEILRYCLPSRCCRRLVETVVEAGDQASLAEELEKCYVGRDLGGEPLKYSEMMRREEGGLDVISLSDTLGRSVNLHTLLDNTGPAELYGLLRP